ncbi:MAG: hypothetical protein MI892_08210 [Desulfobacterales bacterium]|nr:hypothetical protein [Desulfobacterales bacterium]
MKGKQNTGKLISYATGAGAGIVFTAASLYILNMAGIITVSSANGTSLISMLRWCYENLGFSLIPFILIFIAYTAYLRKLHLVLKTETPLSREVFALEEKIDLLTTLFFGVGVIWTAIGMRNALLASLGNMDAETAAQKGAFYILTQLVEGGILLSLSTTIAGGIGGYIMRIIKSWTTGLRLATFMDTQAESQAGKVLERLDNIALLLHEKNRGASS